VRTAADSRGELARLRRDTSALAEECDLLRSRSAIHPGSRADAVRSFEFVRAHGDRHPVATLCRIVGVSVSGYYAWLVRPISAQAARDVALVAQIRAIGERVPASRGVSRMRAELAAIGVRVGRRRVARLMMASGLPEEPREVKSREERGVGRRAGRRAMAAAAGATSDGVPGLEEVGAGSPGHAPAPPGRDVAPTSGVAAVAPAAPVSARRASARGSGST
jgi:hypothetical protein